MKRLLGIAAVWVGCSLAWVVLGSTLLVRTDESTLSGSSDVHQLWGPPAEQRQPQAAYEIERTVEHTRTETTPEGGTREVVEHRVQRDRVAVPLTRTAVEVELELEHRRRGLSWHPTYAVELEGRYTFRNPSDQPREVTVAFPLSQSIDAAHGGLWDSSSRRGGGTEPVFDGFVVRDGAGASVPFEIEGEAARWTVTMAPGESRSFDVGYRTRGTDRWQYRMAAETTRVSNFTLTVRADFEDVDFPDGSVSPTRHAPTADGWEGTWAFESSIASRPIGVEMPRRLNPGPLAARLTFFAPVAMLFFFFVLGVLAMSKKKDLHPMHYFFFGCSFFAFHLLFAYLVDHLSIGGSFGAAALVSVGLAVSYARLFTGWRFALMQLGVSQLIYLVLFSYTFMWEGFTGLAITIGAVLTLFVMMQITGRTRWGHPRGLARGGAASAGEEGPPVVGGRAVRGAADANRGAGRPAEEPSAPIGAQGVPSASDGRPRAF